MSEIRKCKCGSERLELEAVSFGPEWSGQVRCRDCHRSGPKKSKPQAAWSSWNADRLAEEKSREALAEAALSLETISLAGSRNARAEFLRDLVDVRGYATSRAKAAREALSLLEAR